LSYNASHIATMLQKNRQRSEPPARKIPDEAPAPPAQPREIGGPKGPEPTRYGDWEHNGRCTDF
jgi:hypothetical protein